MEAHDDELILDDFGNEFSTPKLYYTLSELRALDLPTPVDVVTGLMSEGETILLVGRPKVGKSRLVLQLAISLSTGEPFLNFVVPKQRRVLILDLENRPSVARQRFMKMVPEGRPTDENIMIHAPMTLSDDCLGLEGPQYEGLKVLIDQTDPDVLVIDTWRLIVGPKDENKSEVILEGLKKLSTLKRKRPQLLTIIVHHLRKQGAGDGRVSLKEDPYRWVEGVSGHHALVGHVDACFGIERELSTANMLDGDDVIVFGGVARNTSPTCVLLDEDEDSLLFSVAKGRNALLDVLTIAEGKIFEAMCNAGRKLTHSQIVEASRTTNRKAVTAVLRKGEAHGVIRKEGQGKGAVYVVAASE